MSARESGDERPRKHSFRGKFRRPGASRTYPRSAAAEASQLGTNELLQQIIFKLEVMLNQQRSSKIDVIVKQIEQILSTNVDIVDLLQKLVALRVAHATAH